MKILTIFAAFFIVSCDLSAEKTNQQIEDCKARGGEPVRMMTLYGKTRRVECWNAPIARQQEPPGG